MRLTPGSRLGPYEVLSTLGTGGMAEVYRARDTRLGRDIALKVVNEALAGNPELINRFEQEARLAGSLNHPNLVAVYDVGLHEGSPYFITELLKGESLRHRLSSGRVPLDSALDWGAKLAHGLAAAHARGIIHRDVKPDNVFVTTDGQVKLLDFGIAKLAEASRAEGPHGILDDTVTPAGGRTETGLVLGTPAYMSPEQVRGERVDARTDIFSLGAVLYEMLAGQRPFAGGSLVESGHAILHDEPPPLPDIPPFLAQLIRRCLAKDPEARLQSASDFAFALEALRSGVGPGPASRPSAVRSFLPRPWWALALLAVLGAAVVIGRFQPSHAPAPPPTVERVTLRPVAFPGHARFTPDGRVVFTATQGSTEELFERNLASASLQPLGLTNMLLAAISSTGELAVFTSHRLGSLSPATLARVAGVGLTPQPVAEDVVAADWSPKGELAIVRREGKGSVLEFPIGKAVFQTTPPAWIGDMRVSPRGDLLAFIHYVTGERQGEVVVVDLQGRRRQVSRHWHRAMGLAWSPRSEVWFTAGDTLPTQLQAMPLAGPERTVYIGLAPIVIHDIAADGSVLIGQGFFERDITFLGEGAANPRSLGWGDRDNSPRISADGRQVLFSTWGTRTQQVALLRKTSGAPPQQLGEGAGMDLSPDGKWALLVRDNDGLTLVATGGGTRRKVPLPGLEFEATRFAGGTSRALSVARASSDSGYRLYSIDLDRAIATPLSEPMKELDGDILEISPDNQWAATNVVVDEKSASVLHPLSGGKPVTLTGLPPDVRPVGWASKDELWFARVEQADPSVIGLIRFDVRRGVTLQERTIGTGGPGFTGVLHLTPDGKNIVFGQERTTGHLYVVRGLQ